jgi:catechol 2,3-dioxygenase-like lactoylglutathione lyase family enzyme
VGATGLDHINIDTAEPEATVAFYTEVLGLENRPDERPDFGFPGAWLFLGDQPVVHLNFIDDDHSAGRSSFNHIAFTGTNFAQTRIALDSLGVSYRTSERPDDNLSQIFVNDPNDIRVELTFRGE